MLLSPTGGPFPASTVASDIVQPLLRRSRHSIEYLLRLSLQVLPSQLEYLIGLRITHLQRRISKAGDCVRLYEREAGSTAEVWRTLQ